MSGMKERNAVKNMKNSNAMKFLPAVFAAALSVSTAFAGGQDEIAKWDPRMALDRKSVV